MRIKHYYVGYLTHFYVSSTIVKFFLYANNRFDFYNLREHYFSKKCVSSNIKTKVISEFNEISEFYLSDDSYAIFKNLRKPWYYEIKLNVDTIPFYYDKFGKIIKLPLLKKNTNILAVDTNHFMCPIASYRGNNDIKNNMFSM